MRLDPWRFLWSALFVAGLFAGPVVAQSIEDKLVIITSFPKDLTGPFQAAFEKKHAGTKVEVLNKSTSAGIKFLEETASKNTTDLFWASAPDAFEVLKGAGLLHKYSTKAKGIPEKIGSYPIHDPDGLYFGFAASGYGIMWNTRYVQAKGLPVAKEWDDLKKPVYFGHVAMSAPSRSGTTHLTVETILQGEGWDKGWATLKDISGNFKTVTERSFGVPDGVNSGDFGFGIVIDFFAFSSQASGFPVDFVYPKVTSVVPANIGIVKNAPHPKAAEAFVEFVLSPEGQEILLDPKIRRLPVNPATYSKAPQGFPNPFQDKSIGAGVKFDAKLSEQRYRAVSALFDVVVTYRHEDLAKATKAIHDAEAALAKKPNAEGAKLVKEARAAVTAMPISAAEAAKPEFAAVFTKTRAKKEDKAAGRQAEVEEQWDSFAKKNYADAKEKADKARSLAK